MTEKPPTQANDTESEADIQRRFQDTLGRMLASPHEPHKPLDGGKAKPAKNTRRSPNK